VIPVLLGKTAMPGQEQLPTELKKLSSRNATNVSPAHDFHHHVDGLIRGIEYLRKATEKKDVEKQRQELLTRQQQEESRQKAELERKRREQEEPFEMILEDESITLMDRKRREQEETEPFEMILEDESMKWTPKTGPLLRE
jgi:hypothetical protein